MSGTEGRIHAFRKVSDSVIRLGSVVFVGEETGSVVIDIGAKKLSDSNVFRKNSDTRLLADADLKFADLINKQKGGGEISVQEAAEVDKDKAVPEDFKFTHFPGLTAAEAAASLALHGPNKLPETNVSKLFIFCQQLWQPMPLMIWFAIIIEAGIQNWIDFGILIFIQFANASIGFYGE